MSRIILWHRILLLIVSGFFITASALAYHPDTSVNIIAGGDD